MRICVHVGTPLIVDFELMRDDYISSAEKSVSLALKHHSSVASMFRLQGRIQRGDRGPGPPEKSQKYRVS